MGSFRPQYVATRTLGGLAETFGCEFAGASTSQFGLEFGGISIAGNSVEPGDLFVALPGANTHGARFAADARDRGAVAVLTDPAGAALAADSGLPVLVTAQVRVALGPVSAWLYRTGEYADQEDSDEALSQTVLGVTGTNGKTSVVYILAALLAQLGHSVALSSTAERRIGDEAVVSGLTTPEANHVHSLLAAARERGVRAVALEISAQALSRHRVDGVVCDVVGFTNLSHDHLDDYGTMEQYFAAKRELFTPERARRGVIVLGDDWGRRLVAESRIPVTTIGFGTDADADWQLLVTEETASHTGFELRGGGRVIRSRVSLLGAFSASNAALAIVMLVESGVSVDRLAELLEAEGEIAAFVPGRAERVSGDRGPLVLIDYAHTPDAFSQLLGALRRVVTGRIIMVFGADGDRDQSKRAEMAAIAARGADAVVITDFHPRFEDPALIRATLVAGARAAVPERHIDEIADPREAFRHALSLAGEGDVLVYAGPGHENYHEVAGQKIPYSARDDARAALREAGWMDD